MSNSTARSAALARSMPGASAAYSPAADAIVDRFQMVCADVRDLEPAEALRLLLEMQTQIAAMATAQLQRR